MLHFPDPLTAAATEILVYCLSVSADMALPDMLGDEWADAYPLSAKCLTPEQSREALLDLLDKLQLPQDYVPTTYHWLLMYECLETHIACLNDDSWPERVERFKALGDARDASYLSFPLDSHGTEGVSINFEGFVEMYFWDTDFLLDPSTFYQLGATSKKQLGYPGDLFSVLTGLTPHPTELVLHDIDEFEARESERGETNEEL